VSNVLIIGKRSRCYKAALELGHKVFLWSDGELHESRKRKLAGWIESPFQNSIEQIPDTTLESLKGFALDYVVAATESSVDLAAMVRSQFHLTGTPLAVSQTLHNKNAMKKTAMALDIPITDFHLITEDDSADFLISKLGLPLVIKPVADSGARGVVVLKSKKEVELNLKPGLLAESFVDGTEVSVETFVHNGKAIFHNITDYLHQWRKSILPASLSEHLKRRIVAINDRVLSGFGVQNGMTHAEFYLSSRGPVFGEMAVRPPGGYYMELIEAAYGFDPWKTYVQLETGVTPSPIPQMAAKQACVLMLHPGAGEVEEITGMEEVQNLTEIDQFQFRVQVGEMIPAHEATSNEVGHFLMSSNSRDLLLERLAYIENTLNIKLKRPAPAVT
jgi:biotin carboxylase